MSGRQLIHEELAPVRDADPQDDSIPEANAARSQLDSDADFDDSGSHDPEDPDSDDFDDSDGSLNRFH
jgi:hypothetical protein